MKHHDNLIEQACSDGWTRGHAWYAALQRAANADPFLQGEWYELKVTSAAIKLARAMKGDGR